jgi:hypothetical protein
VQGFGGSAVKIGKLAALALTVVAFVAGCKGFWNAPATTTTTTTTLSSGTFYVLNQATSQMVALSINSGTLTQVGAYTPAAAPIAIAIAPNHNFLYVSSLGGIYLYNIASDGTLTIGNNGAAISQDPATTLKVDSTNSWLVDAFVAGTGVVQLDAIPLDSTGMFPSGGKVATVSFNEAGASVNRMTISPDNNNIFVAIGTAGTLVVPFTAGALGTSATTIPVAHALGAALSVAVDPTNRLFYIGETLGNSAGTSGGLRVFNYSSLGGTLTQATGSPLSSGGLAPNAILPIASGDDVYVANGAGTSSSGTIQGFAVSAAGTASAPSYKVATGSSTGTGIQPVGLAEDSQANFILAVSTGGSTSSGSPDLEAYIFDTTTAGQLNSVISAKTGNDPVQAIAIAATPP